MKRIAANSGIVADDYLRLIHDFPLRPIRTKAAYALAGRVLDRLVVRPEGSLSSGEQDYLDTLTLLVEEYDKVHCANAPRVHPIELLKHLMQESGINVTGLGHILGNKSIASQVLSGKRSLSKSNIAKLAEHFRLDAGAFFESSR